MIQVSTHNKEQVDRAIALPEDVFTGDGRRIALTKWKPTCESQNIVRVELEGIVEFINETPRPIR